MMSATSPRPADAPLRYLAFDFGTRRVGVAAGNSLLRTAQPLTGIEATGAARFVRIAALIAEWRPDALVLGVPFHPDGTAHVNTHRARAFGRQLHGRFKLPVHEVDERYSSVEALRRMPRGARDGSLDAAAAAVILEQYLHGVPAGPEPRAGGLLEPRVADHA